MDPDMSSFLTEYRSSVCLALHAHQVSCSLSRVVPGAHVVVGPSTHLSSGPGMSVRQLAPRPTALPCRRGSSPAHVLDP
jgi:hypothetical protein